MRIFFAFVVLISCTVVANLLMKTGAMEGGANFLQKLLHWKILLGLAFYAVGAVAYVMVLSLLPLNVAQSFAAAQYIAVILASSLVLREPISVTQWSGIALIGLGMVVVGWARG